MSLVIERYRTVIERFSPEFQNDFLEVISCESAYRLSNYATKILDKLKIFYDQVDQLKNNNYEPFDKRYLNNITFEFIQLKKLIAGDNGELLAKIKELRQKIIEKLPENHQEILKTLLRDSKLKYDVFNHIYPLIDECTTLPEVEKNKQMDKIRQLISKYQKPEEKLENKSLQPKKTCLPKLSGVVAPTNSRKVLGSLNSGVKSVGFGATYHRPFRP